jgi:hypothetical protein
VGTWAECPSPGRRAANLAAGPRPSRPYHRSVPNPALIALTLVLFVLLLAPTDRLRRASWPPRALGAYLIAMLLLGLLVAELPGPARFLVPILIVGYVAPFVTARAGIDRLRGIRRPDVRVERPTVKQVQGPSRDVPPDGAPASVGDETVSTEPPPSRGDDGGRMSRTE